MSFWHFCDCAFGKIFLFVPVGNSSARQIVRRHLNTHTITNQNPDSILSHLSGDSGQYHVFAVVERTLKKALGCLSMMMPCAGIRSSAAN